MFRGRKALDTWPQELAAGQAVKTRRVGGKEIQRLRYGAEEKLAELGPEPCESCCANPGELHALGCYAERCARCAAPVDQCECAAR